VNPPRHRTVLSIVTLLLFPVAAYAQPTTLPSFAEPSISPDGSEIAFISGGDIWTVPAAGGTAHLLISHPAGESRPLYSPDGRSLAFISHRTGNGDIYLLTLDTGDLKRLTFDDATDHLDAFSADGKYLYFHTPAHDIGGSSFNDVYRVPTAGGTPMPVVADRYANEFFASPSPDGKSLAVCYGGIASSQWWRNGRNHGDECELYLVRNLDPTPAKKSAAGLPTFKQLTPTGARTLWSLWSPNGGTLYYVSDRTGAFNLYSLPITPDLSPDAPDRQLTHFKDGRLLWPALSADGHTLVFERDFAIWKLDLTHPGSEPAPVPIKLRGASAGPSVEHRTFNTADELALSPDGRKIAFVTHGEVFAAPAREGGEAVRVTHTAAIESHVTWSPDSRKLLYVADRDGPSLSPTRHLFLYDFATAKEDQLTRGPSDDTRPLFSPDGHTLAFQRDAKSIQLLDLATKQLHPAADNQIFERAPFDNSPASMAFSPRGDYLAFVTSGPKGFLNVYISPTTPEHPDKPRQATFLPNCDANAVSWSPDGTFLLFGTGQRTEDFQLARIDLTIRTPHFREDQFRDLFREPARTNFPNRSPSRPEPRPTTLPTTAPTTLPATTVASSKPSSQPARTPIVFDNIRQRLTLLNITGDVDAQSISPYGKHVLLTLTIGGQRNLYTYPLDDLSNEPRVARQLTSTAGNKHSAQWSPDSKEVYFLEQGRVTAVSIETRATRTINIAAEMDVDFAEEKLAVFRQAWTWVRDQFADARFNGADWDAVRDTYAPRVTAARDAEELRRLLNLMVGELNASHLGVSAPERNTRGTTGRLGLLFDRREYESAGHLRITEVIPLGPAAVAGLKSGDYLLAIDAAPITAHTNLDELLQRKISRRTVLTVASSADGAAKRDLPLLPIDANAERTLQYRAWVESRRQYVNRVSDGRLGYIHMADMTETALARLKTDLDADNQQRQGVVIDVRNNRGGFVNGYALDVFARRNYITLTRRGQVPTAGRLILGQRALDLPTILVTNRNTFSDGEDFTEGYRALHLGQVVGEPTSGSVIYTWNLTLLDGTTFRLPAQQVTDATGQTLEGHPRPVDLPIPRPLGESYTDHDTQLDTAVAELLKQLNGAGAAALSRP